MGTLAGPAARYLLERHNRREITRGSAMRTSYTLSSLDASFGDRPLSTFSTTAVERWLEQHPSWKPGTRATYLGQVHQFTKWLQRRKLIKGDPFADIRPPRRPRPAPQTIPRDDITRLLAVVPDARGRVIVHLQWGLGLRCCGCSNLKIEDIDFGGKTMHIREKGDNERRLPLIPDVEAVVDRYLWEHPSTSGPLLRSYTSPWAGITPSHIGVLVTRWMTAAGVKRRANDGRSAHALRRTALSETAEAGGDPWVLQELAGWASISTAGSYVRRASTERVRAALEAR